jgi:23S rRNA pseudouridine1911/1915/1917 synthase
MMEDRWSREAGPGDDRVDRFLARALEGYSMSRVRDLVSGGQVRVNGRRVKKGDRVGPGDVVEVSGVIVGEGPVAEPDLELAVVYEDDDVAVVDKPAGIPTHPLSPPETGTLVNRTVARWPGTRGVGPRVLEPGLLHRLDAGTSGLVLLGLHPAAFDTLKDDLRRGRVTKIYRALVAGQPNRARSEISVPLARHPGCSGLMVPAVEDAKFRGRPLEALTRYRIVEPGEDVSLLELELVTGVMHQLRAHLAFIGHPVLGDDRYGPSPDPTSQSWALQASALAFRHPRTGEDVEVFVPRPLELADAARRP